VILVLWGTVFLALVIAAPFVAQTVLGGALGALACLAILGGLLRVNEVGVCVTRQSVMIRGVVRRTVIPSSSVTGFGSEERFGSAHLVVRTLTGSFAVPGLRFRSRRDSELLPIVLEQLSFAARDSH
jgi:hypothetical protein